MIKSAARRTRSCMHNTNLSVFITFLIISSTISILVIEILCFLVEILIDVRDEISADGRLTRRKKLHMRRDDS